MAQGKKHERPPMVEEIAAVLKARQGTPLSTQYKDIYRAVFRKRRRLEKEAEEQRQREQHEAAAACAKAVAEDARRSRSLLDTHAAALAQVKKERDDHESRGELLDSMVTPLESQRRQLQELVSAAAEALMERGVPTRMLADDAVPFYYAQHSWEAEQEVPWNVEAERPMSLAEGIAWLHDNPKPPRYPGHRRF